MWSPSLFASLEDWAPRLSEHTSMNEPPRQYPTETLGHLAKYSPAPYTWPLRKSERKPTLTIGRKFCGCEPWKPSSASGSLPRRSSSSSLCWRNFQAKSGLSTDHASNTVPLPSRSFQSFRRWARSPVLACAIVTPSAGWTSRRSCSSSCACTTPASSRAARFSRSLAATPSAAASPAICRRLAATLSKGACPSALLASRVAQKASAAAHARA
mmetsp:Transcript_89937/g.254743  ORF Transcript_89937/g.254743 Transcript_89937/m.254743 type:complete len:213 (-) Transcript_89937:578-1216(-)